MLTSLILVRERYQLLVVVLLCGRVVVHILVEDGRSALAVTRRTGSSLPIRLLLLMLLTPLLLTVLMLLASSGSVLSRALEEGVAEAAAVWGLLMVVLVRGAQSPRVLLRRTAPIRYEVRPVTSAGYGWTGMGVHASVVRSVVCGLIVMGTYAPTLGGTARVIGAWTWAMDLVTAPNNNGVSYVRGKRYRTPEGAGRLLTM
jgi:hypothetical protein